KGTAFAAQFQALGNHLHNRSSQHEARSQRNEVAQVGAVPVSLNDNGAAKNVGRACRKTQQCAEEDGVHLVRGRITAGTSNHLEPYSSVARASSPAEGVSCRPRPVGISRE